MARRSSRSRSRGEEKTKETQSKGMLNLVDAVESPAPERKAAARALDQRIAYKENNQPPRVRRRLIGGVEVPTPERMATTHASEIVGYGKGYLKGSRWLFEGAKNDEGDPLEALEAAGAIASFTGHLRNTALEMQG